MHGNPDRRLNAEQLCDSGAVTYPKPRRTLGRIMRNWFLYAVGVLAVIIAFFMIGVATGNWI